MLPATMRFYHRLRTNAHGKPSHITPQIGECTEAVLPAVPRQPIPLSFHGLPADKEPPILCRDLVVSGTAR
jgi:hypothetical protein